ncbi:MAG: valine--tRNA ligase [Thermoprotei archaeon]|nr:MAG: valine--tRNA ligase [Thermoprotei archaeon]
MIKEKRYNFKEVEVKWQKKWEEWQINKFDRKDKKKPVYSINTPPPYPSGEFHVGNALNHAYIDFAARYKRLRGYNVFFPQGWDCHGLPTEVRVERTLGKSKREVPEEEFLRLCREFTLKWIEPMREAIKRLGCSIDWSTEYRTMDEDYWRRTQLSFVEMYRKGLVYRGEHPVFWCPRCETAIAEAEVEYKDVSRKLYYYYFELEDGRRIPVASTRPELLGACVALAVNPEDDRYRDIVGLKAIVPIYGRKVEILADREVDPEFGTGVVMICTYGDKTDVRWQKRYNLPVIKLIDERGFLTENAGPLKGLDVKSARRKMVELLKEKGYYIKEESIVSSIGTCWRCHTPVEILSKKQWFVKTMELRDRVLEEARKIRWIPEHARLRLEDWVNSLDWDWPISRQRIFATPIPVWYCEKCGNVIVAEPEWLPIDPRREGPKISECPKCGGRSFKGERDVMHTWMDSSITAAVHAGWPENFDARLFPADLQPNGYDIVRTWDYYLIVRGIALFDKAQFKIALINGMMRGTDGRMMHKSYGNYIPLSEVLDKYGADVFRLWIASAITTGSDLRFSWEGLDFIRRFLTKLWNAARFISMFFEDFTPLEKPELKLVDRWILALSDKLVKEVTEAMDNYDYYRAAQAIIDFTWHKFCDHYLEAVKYRMSEDGESKRAAQYTLYKVLLRVLILLAPFAPHIAEEIYQRMFKNHEKWMSITVATWPRVEAINEEDIELGDIIIDLIASMRHIKHEMRIPLNQPLEKATIFVSNSRYYEVIKENLEDISGTLRINNIELKGEGRGEYNARNHPDISFAIQAK